MSVQRESDAWRPERRPDQHVLRTALLCLVLLCFAVRPALAQFTRFQNLNDEQGLGNASVGALAQDRDGYILLGTEAGLYRYDGLSIAAYGTGMPSAAWVEQIVADDAGRTWVVTNRNLYLGQGADFTRIDTGRAPLFLKSPHLLVVSGRDVVLDVGGMLLRAPLATTGVARNAVGTFSPLFGPAALAATPGLATARFVVPDIDGGLLIGCGDAICREVGGVLTILGKAEGLAPDSWQVALRTPDGTIWARSMDRIAWRKPGQAVFTVTTLPGSTLGSQAVAPGDHTSYVANPERLVLQDDGHGGVLTQSAGGLLDWNGSSWQLHSHHPGGIPADRIVAMMRDREGSLWLGSFVTGAYRSIGMGSWEHWTKDDGLPSNIVWSMSGTPNGQVWVATDGGTIATDGTPAGTPAETNYAAVTTRGGRLWLAPVGSALVRRDAALKTVETFPSPGKIASAVIDGNNRLWLGADRGLFVVADADQPASLVHPAPALAHETITLATDPAGVVWVLSPDGVFRRNDTGRFDLVIPAGVLKALPISLSFVSDNEVWIGTDMSGMLRFRVVGRHVAQLPNHRRADDRIEQHPVRASRPSRLHLGRHRPRHRHVRWQGLAPLRQLQRSDQQRRRPERHLRGPGRLDVVRDQPRPVAPHRSGDASGAGAPAPAHHRPVARRAEVALIALDACRLEAGVARHRFRRSRLFPWQDHRLPLPAARDRYRLEHDHRA
ncbi:ligand-binding sensor domain-containing protein [Lichenicola sp.]|uniref:ligand-binding sensor domain-containing protein n=1 Tax=Lichenicola sp. TaxID=2804529 RepID=UPI003B00F324